MGADDVKSSQKLRIEIWMNVNMEWSLEGDGSASQYQQAEMRLRSLFLEEDEIQLVLNKDDVRTIALSDAIDDVKSLSGEKNIMLCDKKYEKMMMFVYSG